MTDLNREAAELAKGDAANDNDTPAPEPEEETDDNDTDDTPATVDPIVVQED